MPLLLRYARQAYGPDAVVAAWDEYTFWEDVPMEPEIEPEIDACFVPWYLFNWTPDNTEVEPARHMPAPGLRRQTPCRGAFCAERPGAAQGTGAGVKPAESTPANEARRIRSSPRSKVSAPAHAPH